MENRTHYEKTILDNIDLEAYDINTDQMKPFDKVAEIYTIFKKEYGFKQNLQRYGGETNTFREWLQGLPSVLTVPFENYEILKNAEKAGFEFMNENLEDAFLDAYWQNLANAFFNLYKNL